MIDSSMITDFIVEAQEHLEELESSLLKLEDAVDDPEVINAAFRAVHTIKGNAQFVGIERIAELSHKLENLLELVRQGEKTLNQEIIDTLIEGKDRISTLVDDLRNYQEERTVIDDILARIKKHEDIHNGTENTPPDDVLEHEYDLTMAVEEAGSKVEEKQEPSARVNESQPELEQKIDNFFGNDKKANSPAAAKESDTEQPGKKAHRSARSDIDTAALKNEIEAEVYDEELFLIFIEQLQENISLLRTLTGNFTDAPDKSHLISQCSDLISRLHSSANYMGYDRLTEFYGQWIAELEMTSLELSTGSPASFDFMDRNITTIAEVFPQIEDITADQTSAEKVVEVPEPDDFSDLFSTVDDAEENEVAEDAKIIAALPGEEPDNKVDEEQEQSFSINEQLPDLEEKLDHFFGGEDEAAIPAAEPEKDSGMPVMKSSDPALPVIDAASLKEEIEAEEFDEELFLIFIQQLQENISLLRSLTENFSGSPNKTSLIKQGSDLVTALYSSANYMGYERLTEFYGQWAAELELTDLQLSIGNPVSFDFMDAYIRTITGIFPQIDDVQAETGFQQPSPAETSEKSVISSDEKFPINKTIEPIAAISDERGEIPADESDFASLDGEYDQFKAAFTDEEDEPEDDVSFDKTFVQNVESLDDDTDSRKTELFKKLSGALESLANVSAEPMEEEENPEKVLSLLKEEIRHEEYDQDLFAIYIQQLQKNITALQSLTKNFQPADGKQQFLRQCGTFVEKMRSSSNYMDYQHLEKFYRHWQHDINLSLDELSDGQPVLIDYMAEKIDIICQVFAGFIELPDKIPQQTNHGAEISEKEEITAVSPPPVQPLPLTDDQLLFDRLSNALEAEEDSLQHDVFNGEFDTETDQQLFDKLSCALDERGFDQETTELKSIDDVINEILTGEGLAKTETKPVKTGQHPPGMKPDFPAVSLDTEAAAKAIAFHTVDEQTSPHALQRTDGADRRMNYSDRRRGPEERRLTDPLKPPPLRRSIRVDTGKIDHLMDQVGELVISRSNISQLYNEIGDMQEYLRKTAHLNPEELRPLHDYALRLSEANAALGRVSSEIQEGVLNVRMRPIAHLFKRYPRFVRDLVHQTDRKVKFKIRGEETELDKMILEEISGPLIHIIRNSVDHGIETVEERKGAGKNETATLLLEAYPDSNAIVIEISDDGRGIDPQRIKKKALELNLFAAEELNGLSDSELIRLIMTPGFSTTAKATRTSGRGVGMDVVHNSIEKLNGTIDIRSQVGFGTKFRINIPLAVSVIQSLAVKVGSRILTIPLSNIEETTRVRQEDITETGGIELIQHRDASLPVFRLAEILNIPTETTDSKHAYILIVKTKGQRAGLIVDGFMRPTEVVVKPLAEYLRNESGFSGATIRDDGTISLILDIAALMAIVKNRLPDEGQKNVLENSLRGLAFV